LRLCEQNRDFDFYYISRESIKLGKNTEVGLDIYKFEKSEKDKALSPLKLSTSSKQFGSDKVKITVINSVLITDFPAKTNSYLEALLKYFKPGLKYLEALIKFFKPVPLLVISN
jgi:hypothetical protein